MCCWIGHGWCSGQGPWHAVEDEDGALQLVDTRTDGDGVSRQLPHRGNAGRGVPRQLPHLGKAGSGQGVHAKHAQGDGLRAWFAALQARLRYVRVCCGDWTRVLGPSVTWQHGLPGVLMDPPYGADEDRDMRIYREDSGTVAHDVRAWCVEHGDNPLLRIVLCGYDTAHDVLLDHGWTKQYWETNGGYGNQGEGRGRANKVREQLWCSPACLPIAVQDAPVVTPTQLALW